MKNDVYMQSAEAGAPTCWAGLVLGLMPAMAAGRAPPAFCVPACLGCAPQTLLACMAVAVKHLPLMLPNACWPYTVWHADRTCCGACGGRLAAPPRWEPR